MSLIPAGDSLGVAIIAIGATGGFLATTAVVFRVWARKIQGIALGWNDYTCILALVFLPNTLRNRTATKRHSGVCTRIDRRDCSQYVYRREPSLAF